MNQKALHKTRNVETVDTFIKENEAPEKCPVCAHPRAYFELMSKNY